VNGNSIGDGIRNTPANELRSGIRRTGDAFPYSSALAWPQALGNEDLDKQVTIWEVGGL